MKLVFDTNVIMDVIACREPFFDASRAALLMATENDVTGAMTANTATDLFFLYRKYQPDMGKRKEALRYLMSALDVLDTTRDLCFMALESPIADFEDALLAESAKQCEADFIVTRDEDGFTDSPVKTITPDELLRRFTN